MSEEYNALRDTEKMVYTELQSALLQEFPSLTVTGIAVNAPKKSPHVSFRVIDCYPVGKYADSSSTVRVFRFTFEARVFSNKVSGKKEQVNEINAFLSSWLYRKNCVTIANVPSVPDDASSYTVISRYEVEVDKYGRFHRPRFKN